jgi:hypothetical protein
MDAIAHHLLFVYDWNCLVLLAVLWFLSWLLWLLPFCVVLLLWGGSLQHGQHLCFIVMSEGHLFLSLGVVVTFFEIP